MFFLWLSLHNSSTPSFQERQWITSKVNTGLWPWNWGTNSYCNEPAAGIRVYIPMETRPGTHMGKHQMYHLLKQHGGKKMNRNCWQRSEKQCVGNTRPAKRPEENPSSSSDFFFRSSLLNTAGLKILSPGLRICLSHPHSSASTPHALCD